MNQNRDDFDILIDMDGTVIMLDWQTLFVALAGCLHRRALTNPLNLLGNLGTDMVRFTARYTYRLSLNGNYARLCQVFELKMTRSFEGLEIPHAHLQLVTNGMNGREMILYNMDSPTKAEFRIIYDTPGSLTVIMQDVRFFRPFMEEDADSFIYHTLDGSAFAGFQEVQEADLTQEVPVYGRNYFGIRVTFPGGASFIRMLMEDAVPDLDRLIPPHPYCFAVIARNLRRRHAAVGLIAEIITSTDHTTGPIPGSDVGLVIGDSEKFNVSVDFHSHTMNLKLYPASAFSQNMEQVIVDGVAKLSIIHTIVCPQEFGGFVYHQNGVLDQGRVRREYNLGWYEREFESVEKQYISLMERVVDAAVEIGTNHPTTTPTCPTPTCPHCGVEMGEGGMAGMPCAACARLGLGPA